jgi:7-keto-8-aminopelargonate synthetase-like enzyme
MVVLKSGVGSTIQSGGRTYHYFAGNNYLGLANHHEVIAASKRALETYGISFSASRVTTGTSDIHMKLEDQLSLFKDRADTTVFATGYLGNKMLMEALSDDHSAVYADSMAHSSVFESIPSRINHVARYNHCNPDHLEDLLKRDTRHRPIIITDGIFALTGDIAPLDNIYGLARMYNAIVIVDDAHGTGVIGKTGKGTPEYFNLESERDIFQAETMSKALGSYGGFISGDRELIEKIRSGSAFYRASTALPPPIVAAGIASLRIIAGQPGLMHRLAENGNRLRTGVRELGFETTSTVAPIVPLFFEKPETAVRMSQFLEEHDIIAPAVSYPVKIDKYIVRLTVSASHTADQIDHLLETIKIWRNMYGID